MNNPSTPRVRTFEAPDVGLAYLDAKLLNTKVLTGMIDKKEFSICRDENNNVVIAREYFEEIVLSPDEVSAIATFAQLVGFKPFSETTA